MAHVGFIGTGELASAMVRGLVGQGHDIWVSERNAVISANLAKTYADVSVGSNQTVLDACDIVFLCLMDTVAKDVLPDLSFRAGQKIVSVMLGVSLVELQTHCAPADEISITIPLPFIARGGCPLPVYPESKALSQLYGSNNLILPMANEAALAPHFAATALLSPIFAQLQTGAHWLGSITGDPKAAEAYIAALFKGTFDDIPADGFAGVLQGLSTEGGLNATLRQHMADQGALGDLTDGLDALRSRLGISDAKS